MKGIITTRYSLILVVLSAILARLFIVFFYSATWFSADSYTYIHQAEVLLKGGYPTYFPNGYPLQILITMLFNQIISFEISLLVINIILSCGVVLLVFKCGELIFNKNIYVIAAALLTVLYPNQLNYVRYILTEVPAAFLLTLAVYLLYKEKIKFSAVTIGILAIIKTSFLPLGILFTGYLFLKDKGIWKGFLLYFLIPPFVLLLYGFIISGELTLGNNAYHNLTLTATDFNGSYRGKNQSIENYKNYIVQDPVKYLKDRIASLWELWGPLASKTEKMRGSFIYRLLAGLRFPLLILASYSIFKLRKNKAIVLMAMAIITVSAVHIFFFSSPRFTYPLEPILILLAVKGWEIFHNKNLSMPVITANSK